jgi:hypothetical protein
MLAQHWRNAVADTQPELAELSDDELTRLALAADPNAPIPDDAVSFWDIVGDHTEPLLPAWYMPAPSGGGGRRRRWKRVVAITLIVAFLVVDAYGLCSVYGSITIA